MATQSQLDEHYGYLSDTQRMHLLQESIRKTVRAGDRVLDLGCGTGVLGLLCLEAGAEHVTLLDETEMIDVARRSMERAGHLEKCSFVQAKSTEVTLPDRVDLIVSDNIGFFGIDYDVLGTLKDAKKRFLKPEGRIFPQQVRLFVSLVEFPNLHTQVSRWTQPGIPNAFHWLAGYSANYKWPMKQDGVLTLSATHQLAEFVLGNDSPDFADFSSKLMVTQTGTANGVLGWFEADLTSEIMMSNCPKASSKIGRPQAFFPFDPGLPLVCGERVKLSIKTRLPDHIWVWQASLLEAGLNRIQSTVDTLTRQQLQLHDKASGLNLTKRGELLRAVLSYCDSHRSAMDIEELIVQEHKKLLPTEDALRTAIRRELGRFTETS